MLLELLGAAALLCLAGGSLGGSNDDHKTDRNTSKEEYWYTDEYGRDHCIDEDEYCQECDDYHDDY